MTLVITPAMIGQVIISGLLAGSLYAMVALGLGLVFGVMRVLNVARSRSPGFPDRSPRPGSARQAKYASRAAVGRRLAAGPVSSL